MDFSRHRVGSIVIACLLLSVSIAQAQVAPKLTLPRNDADGRFSASWPTLSLGHEGDATWDNSYYEDEECVSNGEDDDCDIFYHFPDWLTVEQKYTLQEGIGSTWVDVYTVSQFADEDGDDWKRAKTLSHKLERPYAGNYRFRLVTVKSFNSSSGCGGANHCLPVGSHVVSTTVGSPKLISVNSGIVSTDTSGSAYNNIASTLNLPNESRSGFYKIEYSPIDAIADVAIEEEQVSLEYRKGTTGAFKELVKNLTPSGHIVKAQEPGIYQYRVKHDVIYYDYKAYESFIAAGYQVERTKFISNTRQTVYEQPKQIEVLEKEFDEIIVFVNNGGILVPIKVKKEREFPLDPPAKVRGIVDAHGNASVTWEALLAASEITYELESYDNQARKWNSVYRGLQNSYLVSNLSTGQKRFRIKSCSPDECSVWVPLTVVVRDVAPTQCLPFVVGK